MNEQFGRSLLDFVVFLINVEYYAKVMFLIGIEPAKLNTYVAYSHGLSKHLAFFDVFSH